MSLLHFYMWCFALYLSVMAETAKGRRWANVVHEVLQVEGEILPN